MCSLSFLSLVSVACAVGGAAPAPAIVADGAGLLIAAGNGGNVDIDGEDITFVVGAGKAAKRVSVLTILNQLAQALDNVTALQATVVTLSGDVATLTDAVANCNTATDGWRLDASAKLEQLPVLENSININTETASALAASIESIKEVQADGEDGIQFELSALAKELSALTNKTNPTCKALGTYDDNLAVHDSVLATDHVVGFVFTMRCSDGWYPPAGDVDLTCFPSGNYCQSHTFPFDACAQQVALPACKPCPDGCTTCTSATKCTACTAGAGLFLSRSGQCVKHLDCTGYQLAGMLQQGVNDFVSLGLEMVLKNGKTSKNVKCLVDEDDNLYEVIPCTDLSDGNACVQSSTYGLETSKKTTCHDAGYMLFAFRTKAHYKLMYQAYGALELNTWVRVTSTTLNIANPWRHYPRIVQPFSTCAMNSASVGTACAKYFSVPDGGDWWLKDEPNGEPNGQSRNPIPQQTGWYMRTSGFTEDSLSFNDEKRASNSGTTYFCIPRTD